MVFLSSNNGVNSCLLECASSSPLSPITPTNLINGLIELILSQIKIEEVSKELHNTMEFEQNVLKKINSFENNHQDADLIKYAKMICRNVIERETSLIQETYLKKIDSQYLNSK